MREERQVDLQELDVNWVYIVNSIPVNATQGDPVSKQSKKIRKYTEHVRRHGMSLLYVNPLDS